jgi:outer membrane protein OmpA-like peptidoglycan-associated protein
MPRARPQEVLGHHLNKYSGVFMKLLALIILVACSLNACKTTQNTATSQGKEASAQSKETKAMPGVTEMSPVPKSIEDINSTIILFAHDNMIVDEKHAPIIAAIAALLKDTTSIIYLEGYADDNERPDSAYQTDLGLQRMSKVRYALMKQGVDLGRFRVLSHGRQRPVGNTALDKYNFNRRVTFRIESKEKTLKVDVKTETQSPM